MITIVEVGEAAGLRSVRGALTAPIAAIPARLFLT